MAKSSSFIRKNPVILSMCVRSFLRACVRACVRAFFPSCMRACVRAFVRACVRACVPSFVHAHVQTKQSRNGDSYVYLA